MLKIALCDNDEKYMSYIENLIMQQIPEDASIKIEKKHSPSR